MKPAAFDYVRARSLAEAIELLARPNVEARVVAGGQSLLAMMNLRVANPDLLIDISRLPELTGVREEDDAVVFGACVTHAMIEDRKLPDPSRGLMAKAAATLAYRAVRNRGTLGGSLALADPAAEWPAVLAALDAAVVVQGREGTRTLSCVGFVTGIYETQLAEGEILTAIRVPKLSDAGRWSYVKLARKSGEFASALAVVVRDPAHGHDRLVLGAADGPPVILDQPFANAPDLEAIAAARHLDDFQRSLLAVAAQRAVAQADA